MNPDTGRFEPLEFVEQGLPDAPPQVIERQRNWTKFEEGEIVDLKGVGFRVAQIEPTRMVLRPLVKEKA